MFDKYDVIVVGAGHAGCEAAAAAANLGSTTLLVTMNLQTIAQMSCNPAMGGIAKGQIVREIDALGGYSGIISDTSMIQFRMLNMSKGPAMWSPRTQNDRMLFSKLWREKLESIDNLHFYQDSVTSLIINNEKVAGIVTSLGNKIRAKAVVITAGTFLNGIIHIGEKQMGGGRVAEKASSGITEQLESYGFESARLKTGTPPRIDGRSLDYSKFEEQKGDSLITGFSYLPTQKPPTQKSCWIAYTNAATHDILRSGFDRSPMYAGRIEGSGPRYCPSIEDKINRFAERERHQLFVEPEGWDTHEIYVNGFSTSLPEEVQVGALRKVPGFENARFFRPGYAIEYDFFPPTQLHYTLETKGLANLFFAGQINGTTGYEEAAGQGIMAGINAHLKVNDQEGLVLRRNEAYIGVLIDDLVGKGTQEPYRMFTSRAEFRTLLRQDNADLRLTEKSYKLGLAKEDRMWRLDQKQKNIQNLKQSFATTFIEPFEIKEAFAKLNNSQLFEKQRLERIILRPDVRLNDLKWEVEKLQTLLKDYPEEDIEQAEIQTKYQVYIDKEKELAARLQQLEALQIPETFDFKRINSLSAEAKEKLTRVRPQTLGQASRISGINPSDVQILMVYMGR